MTKIIRKTKKVRMTRIAFITFALMGLSYLGSQTLLRSYNVSLSAAQQRLESEIETLSAQKESLTLQINELKSTARVMEIATADGLTRNESNVVRIPSPASSDTDKKDTE